MSSQPQRTSLSDDGPTDGPFEGPATIVTTDAQSATSTIPPTSDRPTSASTAAFMPYDKAYWCHACEREVDALLDSGTPTCAICGSDFVEEMDEAEFHHDEDDEEESDEFGPVFGGFGAGNVFPPAADQPDRTVEMIQMWMQELLGNSGTVTVSREDGTTTLRINTAAVENRNASGAQNSGATNETSREEEEEEETPGDPTEPLLAENGEPSAVSSGERPESRSSEGRRRRNRPGGMNASDIDMASEAIFRIFESIMGRSPIGRDGLSQFINLLGNPGDYAVGQRDFDAILTRLMEQGSSGPQRASEEKISALPRVNVEASMIAKQVDCTVCQEDFVPEEEVTRLPCEHYFHPPCIEQWLKINGSCPVCRFSLNGETEETPEDESDGAAQSTSEDGNAALVGSGVEDLD
ncbi:hypothetical protein BJ742DRAFT_833088 [Cladochytrium replicatum]|nr:hypothetical protein BJ742DRAFT_833088 [Cladochytrium replicatum]